MEIGAGEADDCGFGGHAVYMLPNTFVTVDEGVRLALRLWLPSRRLAERHFGEELRWKLFAGRGEDEEKFPSVLEYLPSRKDDLSAERDFRRHAWTASHGYVVVRADVRGTGASDGECRDEYSPEELGDGRSLIGWLSSRPWANGRVGVFGKSWAGFNGLQLAELNCPGLAAVVSVYSSDDRFNTDVHYTGGCVLGSEALTWSSHMLTINSLPPAPAARPSDWKEVWRRRLDSLRPWIDTWIGHQTLDAYWRRGSVRFDCDRIRAPVLLVGGWLDAYADALLRLGDSLPRCCSLLGPWSHQWPDAAPAGQAVHFARECLRWWDATLKDRGDPPPPFRVFARTEPDGGGEWLSAASCSRLQRRLRLRLAADMRLLVDDGDDWTEEGEVPLSGRVECGLWHGEWLSYGAGYEAPDQQAANAFATIWTLADVKEEAEILGAAELTLRLRARRRPAAGRRSAPVLGARLCDLDPDTGRQTLVAWGALNLNLQPDQSAPRPFDEGDVRLQLRAASYRVRRGHSLLLALSSCLWPLAWHSGAGAQLSVVAAGCNCLLLPLLRRAGAEATGAGLVFAAPSNRPLLGPPPPSTPPATGVRPARLRRFLEDDFGGERYVSRCRLEVGAGAELLLPDGFDLRLSWSRDYRHSVGRGGDCPEPKSEAEHRLELRWPSQRTTVGVSTSSSLSSDAEANFRTRHSVLVTLNGEEFFRRTYENCVSNQTAF